MPKQNTWIAIKMLFGVTVTLVIMTMWGCNTPSVPTAVNKTLLNSDLTSLLEEEARQPLDITNAQQHEKIVSICPEDSAKLKVVIDSIQGEQTTSQYLTKVTMTVAQNGGFQIEPGDRGTPTNLGNENAVVMAVPYLITCSKVRRFSELSGQSLVEVYADGRVQVR